MTGAADPPYAGREPQPYVPRDAQPFPREAQPYQPRETQHYAPREPQPYAGRPQPPVPQPRAEGGDPERLPAVITGGGQPPQPAYQGFSPNGFDGQPDRFPLHRRRRRRPGGPRGDMPARPPGTSDPP